MFFVGLWCSKLYIAMHRHQLIWSPFDAIIAGFTLSTGQRVRLGQVSRLISSHLQLVGSIIWFYERPLLLVCCLSQDVGAVSRAGWCTTSTHTGIRTADTMAVGSMSQSQTVDRRRSPVSVTEVSVRDPKKIPRLRDSRTFGPWDVVYIGWSP